MNRTLLGRLTLPLVLALTWFAWTPSHAQAQAQDFILANQTGVDIFKVFVSPHDVDNWEEDILGADVLLDGDEVEILFHREEDAEYWDLRIEDEEGNAIEWENLNLFEILRVTLFYDADTGRAWAEVETVDDGEQAVQRTAAAG